MPLKEGEIKLISYLMVCIPLNETSRGREKVGEKKKNLLGKKKLYVLVTGTVLLRADDDWLGRRGVDFLNSGYIYSPCMYR